jgi:copper chaperone NosL
MLACGGTEEPAAGPAVTGPVSIDDQEGAVCGMLLRDQPAPRAQVVHRDGERAFVCSIGDLLVHLSAPSPHGHAEQVLVEVVSPDADPSASDTGPHEWVAADQAFFVVGIPRKGVMGPAVLAYRDSAVAESVAASVADAQVLRFEGLRQWHRARGY